ncbi:hypothetical protein BGW41_002732 [Actinomortierella wolfii]|nr:hypothetical protein BGW41_002732 [Actinomortierella wolfii]
MPSLTKTLLISSALAITAFAQAPDPCTVLHKATVANNVSYDQIANCYKSISFNSKDAMTTIDSLMKFYDDILIFRDMALTPTLQSPFSLKSVDALAELRRIRRTRYRRDFDFHKDLTSLANSFQDAHSTYAHNTKSGLEDCEVLTISGVNARNAVQSYADRHTGFSKDAGVRFNFALASHTYWPQSKVWLDTPGMFSMRLGLPETPFLDYVIQCKDQKIRRVRGEWDILPLHDPEAFTDRATFVSSFCANSKGKENTQVTVSTQKNKNSSSSNTKATPMTDLLEALYLREHGKAPDSSLKDFPEAKQWAGNNTAVYQLKSMPHVGVLVIPTMEQDSETEIPVIQSYLQLLAKSGVTNIIIDMTGNFGGEEAFASLLPAVFFKTANKATNSHKFRYRVTPAIQKLTDANLQNDDQVTYWNPKYLTDLQSRPFKTNPFKDTVNLTFNGRSATYSQWVYLDYDLSIVDPSITYPWSNDPSKVVILTDGQCGSACGMTSDHLVNTHGIKAVGIGGHHGKALSMFSFPGASVVDIDDYVDAFETLDLEAPIKRLPYENSVAVGFRYVASGNDTQPLEYNPKRFPAAMRLDYNPDVAHHHDKMWVAVAKTAWK